MTARRDYPLQVHGLQLYVTEWGDPQAWPVVMLHGIRGYAETFAGIAAALQPGCRVIAYDQRGRGRSDWDPCSNYYNDAYQADLEEVVRQLGLDCFDLLGHSMGGIVAITYAAMHPQRLRRLVIEDAGPGAFESSPGARRIRRELIETPPRFAHWQDATDYMRSLRPSVTEEARQQRLHSMLKPDGQGGLTWRHDHVGIATTRLDPDPGRVVDLRPAVARIACPTLVVRGGRSDYLSADIVQSMVDANPLVIGTEVVDAGHYVHDDQPAAFETVVRPFLLEGTLP